MLKSGILLSIAALCCAAVTPTARAQSSNSPPPVVTDEHLKKAGLKAIGNWQVDPAETQELDQLFANANAAANSIPPSADAGVQRHGVNNALRAELENFLIEHPDSAYGPAVHQWLGQQATLLSGYTLAISHFEKAFETTSSSPDPTALSLAMETGGSLAKLLALTGQITDLDLLLARVRQIRNGYPMLGDWRWAVEMRAWVRRHPNEAYKCGLYCLDQLGRMTQTGQFIPKNITETESSTNGFTAADLLNVAARVGLHIHAATLTDTNNLPVPSIVHLRSEHFVLLREQRGSFYEVFDPVAYGPRWLLASEIIEEATGCVLVSDATPVANSGALVAMSSAQAASFRGRCHGGQLPDQNDHGHCITCPCPPGSPPPPPPPSAPPGTAPGGHLPGSSPAAGPPATSGGQNAGRANPQLPAGGGSCTGCGQSDRGAPAWHVNEPYLNLWLSDTPIPYSPAYGPSVELQITKCSRSQQSALSLNYWYGASIGIGSAQWNCTWFSFAELSTDGYLANVMLPGGGWTMCAFTNNSTYSSMNYHDNLWLEKQGPNAGIYPNSVTNLVLHFPDGSLINYGLEDTNTGGVLTGVFYMTSRSDETGISSTFAYDANHYLKTVTSADGTYFTLTNSDAVHPQFVTSVGSSYGASAFFQYDSSYDLLLTNITDAAGISSWIVSASYFTGDPWFGDPVALITPYGTTGFNNNDNDNGSGDSGVFDRIVEITNAIGQIEFYGLINDYPGTDWANFSAAAVPTNTPLGTLDTDSTQMAERNTFYFNAQQFSPYVGTALASFDYSILKQGRIRHWLAATDPTYTHFDTLSSEQLPSPDGTTLGQTTWYDYAGKPLNVNYEIGTQIIPSVIARVMPDGSTWYQYIQTLTNGRPTSIFEAWMDSGVVHTRSNTFTWAANGADLLSWTNALGIQVLQSQYNGVHQVVTNYDALGQLTTNGYDSTSHLLTSSKNPAGLITLYNYTASHRISSIVDLPVNRTNTFTWNSDGTMATHTDPRNMTQTYFWNSLHQPTGTSDGRGSTTNLYYVLSGSAYANSSGGTKILDITAHRDRLGNWTSYVYDGLRRKIMETNANAVVTGYGYCACGSVNSITNAWNTSIQQVTTNYFDNQSRLSYTTFADGYSVTNWYDSLGRVVVRGDGGALRWLFYNNLNLLTVRSNAYGAEFVQSYDALERPVYVTDPNGVMVTNTYDNLSRLLTRGYPDGGVERFGYSAKGLIAYTNQLTMTNFYAFDELGRKTYETNANGEILKYTNSAAGDLLSLTDGKNQTTQWKYDQYARVTNKLDQAGTVILKYIYDSEDRLTNRWSIAKGTTTYTYDNIGNLKSIVYPNSPAQTYSYDWLNRLTNMVDAMGTTKYTYTAGNQVWTEVPPSSLSPGTITNTYVNRLRTSMTLQQRTGWPLWTNNLVYDAAGRLTNVTSPAGAFSYTLGGASPGSLLIKKLALPNTAYVTNTFNAVARLTGTYLDNSANTVLDSAVYGYNQANQRTAFTNAAGTYVQYSYDPIGQLKVADSSVNTEDRGYFYDSAWNLNRLTNNGTASTFSVDTKNQLTADPNSGTDTYDGNGNLTQRTVSGGNLVYGYDDENRLTNIVLGTTYNSVFSYDGLSRLRYRQDYVWTGTNWYPQGGTGYLYDGNRVIQERNSSDVPVVSYTRGTDLSGTLEGAGGIGGLLARSSGYSSGNWTTHHFYHADGNGNITYLVDSSQAMAATYRYDPLGNTISSSGTLAATNTYRFSSKEIYANAGIYVYLYRFYDPASARWLNRDPVEELGGINTYGFARNNSVNRSDPLGLNATDCAAAMQELADAAADFQQSMGPLTYEVYVQALANAKAACGDDLPPAPPPTPVTDTFPVCPSPSHYGYRNPGGYNPPAVPPWGLPPPGTRPPKQSFCHTHPSVCIGIGVGAVGVGVGLTCALQPELCIGAIRVGVGVGRGIIGIVTSSGGAPVLAGAGAGL